VLNDTIIVDNCTGVFHILEKINFEVFPNPANTYLYIKNSELQENGVKIIDILGKECNSNILIEEDKINISKLNNGIYFIKIGNETRKFIKE